MSKGSIIILTLISCVAFSATAIAQSASYVPDPIMLSATDSCTKTVKRATKKAQQICVRKIPNVDKKINRVEDKIVKTSASLQRSVESNDRRRENLIERNHISCQRQINSIYQKLASNALLKQQAQEAIFNCIGGLLGFDTSCSDRNQRTLLKLVDQETKLLLKLESTEDKCDVKKQRIIDQYADRNQRASDKANDRIADYTTDIEEYLVDIDVLLADVLSYSNEIVACGGQPVSCQ